MAYKYISIPSWVNVLAGSVTLATVLSFAPPIGWIFTLLEHPRPQYCLVLVIALLKGLLSRKPWRTKRWSLIWLIPLVMNLGLIVPLFIKSTLNSDDAEQVVITHPNLLLLLHTTLNNDNPDVSRAIKYINSQAPDIVSLLEVTPQSLLQFQSGLTGYQLVSAEPRMNSHGSAWFVSKQPLHPITIKGSELIHLPSNSDRPLLKATITYGGKTLDLLCFHVIRPRNSGTINYQQVEFDALVQWSRSLHQNQQRRLVVIGDFNSTSWYRPFRQMLHESGLVNSQNGFGLQPTWHSSLPALLRIPIDHCLHSPSLVTVERSVGPNVGSDHLPLLVALRL